MDQAVYYGSLIIESIIVVIGFYFGLLAVRAGRQSGYSNARNAKASLLFSICIVLISLGFMLMVMTTDRTQISEYLGAFLILELIFGAVFFLGCFISQWLWMNFRVLFFHKKKV
jgi:glucan phosphoethanolaminetransferase (alkaline phosphatase superfamily)